MILWTYILLLVTIFYLFGKWKLEKQKHDELYESYKELHTTLIEEKEQDKETLFI